MAVTIRKRTLDGGRPVAGETMVVETWEGDRCISTLFTVYRPPRKRDETPIQYRKRTGCVDDRFSDVHKGWYYCNPAHCSLRWREREARDRHLARAYDVLG